MAATAFQRFMGQTEWREIEKEKGRKERKGMEGKRMKTDDKYGVNRGGRRRTR